MQKRQIECLWGSQKNFCFISFFLPTSASLSKQVGMFCDKISVLSNKIPKNFTYIRPRSRQWWGRKRAEKRHENSMKMKLACMLYFLVLSCKMWNVEVGRDFISSRRMILKTGIFGLILFSFSSGRQKQTPASKSEMRGKVENGHGCHGH